MREGRPSTAVRRVRAALSYVQYQASVNVTCPKKPPQRHGRPRIKSHER